jgi:poly(A) polymerase
MREMIALQPRFAATRGKRAMNLLDHRRFRAAYDFMMLLAEVGQFDPELARFWTDVQKQSPGDHAQTFQVNRRPRASRRGRRRRRGPTAGNTS